KEIQDHHDALRAVFPGGRAPRARVNAPGGHPFHFEVITPDRGDGDAVAAMEAHAEGVQRGLDLKTGPLMKSVLYRLADGDRLLVVIHHLVVDGVSWRILLEDLERGYGQRLAGEPIDLGPRSTSFAQWAREIETYAAGETLPREASFWSDENIPRDAIPLPADHPGGENLHGASRAVTARLTERETEALLTGVHHAYHTEINDILMTALGRALKGWLGRDRTLVLLEGHGREPLERELDLGRTVGWFTSLHPFLLEIPGDDIGRQIKHVKESIRRIPHKGVGYGILKYATPADRRDGFRFTREPRLTFNYLGQFHEEEENGFFRFADESAGREVSPAMKRRHDLDVGGVITRGRLTLSILFSPGRHEPETAELLLENFKKELLAVTAHCRARREMEKTPADFSHAGLTGREYETILDRLGDSILDRPGV
ncbi:MAG: non-ribosomal peptide synthetase, partial [Desulfobacterales bacterium]|nr:non-ribosomal peptide synthetase [Desulfobacterales bacterium]